MNLSEKQIEVAVGYCWFRDDIAKGTVVKIKRITTFEILEG